jgi:hypothetical protein
MKTRINFANLKVRAIFAKWNPADCLRIPYYYKLNKPVRSFYPRDVEIISYTIVERMNVPTLVCPIKDRLFGCTPK